MCKINISYNKNDTIFLNVCCPSLTLITLKDEVHAETAAQQEHLRI